MGSSRSDDASSSEHYRRARPMGPGTTPHGSSEPGRRPKKKIVVRCRFTLRFFSGTFTLFLFAMLYAGITEPSPAAIVVGGLGAAIIVPMFTVGAFRGKIILDGPVLTRIDGRGRRHTVRLDMLRSVDAHKVAAPRYSELIVWLRDEEEQEVQVGSLNFRVRGFLRLIGPWCHNNPDLTIDTETRRRIDAAERGIWWFSAWWSGRSRSIEPGRP